MRPYIIINGMNSALVDGLLISDLPDIKKPLKRTNIVEIDGRDGDIVQELGYSSYEKEITIGLYGKYDIDKVIQYFNGSGEVIFSNEPDKTYTYTILDEISYEKLNRFKTAKVKFHVQPFKRSAVERKETFFRQLLSLETGSKTQNGLTLTWNGNSISISGTATASTRFMIPITLKTVAGTYNWKPVYTYSGANISFRICNAITDSESFGNKAFTVEDADSTVTESTANEYHYLAVEYTGGAGAFNEQVTINVNANQFEVINRGNVYSRPVLTVYGSGDVTLKINGNPVLALSIVDNIVIDAEGMNAYHEGQLYNRHVLGNYANVVLIAGKNIISWEGTLTKIEIENYSRWI